MLLTLTALGTHILEEGKIIIPMINKKLDAEGNIVDSTLIGNFKALFNAFQRSISL
ncbi:hypothetical protein [Dictyobacter halimunensis]|uniref:hypothetical protein n=1 Tax=Dictyobacter halimunensis TaxID=3026934 RepID=UPI0030C7124C